MDTTFVTSYYKRISSRSAVFSSFAAMPLSPMIPVALYGADETKKNDGEDFQLIIICTVLRTEKWFTKLVLPQTRYRDFLKKPKNLTFFDMTAHKGFGARFKELMRLIHLYKERAKVFACNDDAMELYSAVLAELKKPGRGSDDDWMKQLTGANFYCYQMAINKFACRQLIRGCTSIKSLPVFSGDEFLPEMGSDAIFKPLTGTGSWGVFKIDKDTASSIKNPLKGTFNEFYNRPQNVLELLYDKESEFMCFNSKQLVGLIEEYVPPENRRTVSVEGWVNKNQVFHYVICETIYKKDEPEVIDYLVTPAINLSEEMEKKVLNLYDEVSYCFLEHGLENQLFNVEMFIFPDGRVAVCEVNCRCSGDYLPVMGWLYGDESCRGSPGDLFSCSIDLIRGKDVQRREKKIHDGKTTKTLGVCTYLYTEPARHGVIPEIESKQFSATSFAHYYCPTLVSNGYVAYIYAVVDIGKQNPLNALKRARALCDTFYEELAEKYN